MDDNDEESAMTASFLEDDGPARRVRIDPNRSIFIVGMPGTGKSTLALIAAAALGWQYLDTDRILSRKCDMPLAEYIQIHGEMRFRDLESSVLAAVLNDCSTGYVIACGGGICDRPENRALLEQYVAAGGIAIHVSREKDLTQAASNHLLYKQDRSKVRALWQRRTKIFFETTRYTFANLAVPALDSGTAPTLALKPLEDSFLRYLRIILCKHGPVIPQHQRSYTILVDTSSIRNMDRVSFVEAACRAHAVEIFINQLPPSPSATPAVYTGAHQTGAAPDLLALALIFEQIRRLTSLPLIFSMRKIRHQLQHAGLHTRWTESDYLALAFLCFRIGAEYLTLDFSLSQSILTKILERKPRNTRIIVSHSFGPDVSTWTHPAVRSAYAQAVHAGADLVRLELDASSASAALSASSLHEEISRAGTPPCITVIVGHYSQLTPIVNTIFTPVAHQILASPIGWESPSFDHAVNSLYHTGLENAVRICALPSNTVDPDITISKRTSADEQVGERMCMLQHGLQLLHIPHIVERTDSLDQVLAWFRTSHTANSGAVADLTSETILPSDLGGAIRRSASVKASGHFDLLTSHPATLHNVYCGALENTTLKNLSPINAVTRTSSAFLIGAPDKESRSAFAALVAMGFMQIYLAGSDSGEVFLTSDRDQWDIAGSPNVTVLSEDMGTLQPTVIIVAGSLSLRDAMPSRNPFGSFTGGTVVNLLRGKAGTTTATSIRNAIASSSNPEGWVIVDHYEVEKEATAIAFKLLTGFGLPSRAFTGIGASAR